eukprot:sb/3473465/
MSTIIFSLKHSLPGKLFVIDLQRWNLFPQKLLMSGLYKGHQFPREPPIPLQEFSRYQPNLVCRVFLLLHLQINPVLLTELVAIQVQLGNCGGGEGWVESEYVRSFGSGWGEGVIYSTRLIDLPKRQILKEYNHRLHLYLKTYCRIPSVSA